MRKKILFIVESNFLSTHVGVKRVILYYMKQLVGVNWEVAFGTPVDGKILIGSLVTTKVVNQSSRTPYYKTNSEAFLDEKIFEENEINYSINWSDKIVEPNDYDVNFVTAPWVCALGIPLLPRVIGIVYDLVPNLLATGCLQFRQYLDIYSFAHDHDIGFDYYIKNADKIICISDATRNDFLEMYSELVDNEKVVVDIPFEQDISLVSSVGTIKNVLMVNALDWRKNFANIGEILHLASKKATFTVTVIGKERLPLPEALEFFSTMKNSGIDIEWYRGGTDTLLNELYNKSSVLLFPSLYEGLGLPILEAQAMGVPAITSNVSSCPEINLNPMLCFDTNDVQGMADSLVGIITDTNKDIKREDELKKALTQFLSVHQNPIFAFNLD